MWSHHVSSKRSNYFFHTSLTTAALHALCVCTKHRFAATPVASQHISSTRTGVSTTTKGNKLDD
jgi:hypothetical protein